MLITTTRSERTVRPPSRLIEEMSGIQLTNQMTGIEAGIGGDFDSTWGNEEEIQWHLKS